MEFGDDAMVFNPVSWETHRVSTLVVLVLEALMGGMRRVDEVVASLPPSDLTDAALNNAVGQTIHELVQSGIVRRASSP